MRLILFLKVLIEVNEKERIGAMGETHSSIQCSIFLGGQKIQGNCILKADLSNKYEHDKQDDIKLLNCILQNLF